MDLDGLDVPPTGERIRYDPAAGTFSGVETPVIPVVCGEDGDALVSAARRVLDAGADEMGREIHWLRVPAGSEDCERDGSTIPDDTVSTLDRYRLSLVGPLPERARERLLAVARDRLAVDTEMRPLSHLEWTPSPVSTRSEVDVVCFRDVTEDSAAGLEFADGSSGADRVRDLLESERYDAGTGAAGFGIRPITRAGTERLVDRAMEYALDRDRSRVTVVHQGDRLPATEGGFRRWAMEYLEREYGDAILSEERFRAEYDAYPDDELVIGQRHTDDVHRELLTHPGGLDVLVAPALAGHHVAAVGATAVGGAGVTPAALLGDGIVLAGPAPDSGDGGDTQSNPIATIRAGCLLFETMGWDDAAGVVRDAIEATLADGVLTRDLARETAAGETVSPAEFAGRVVETLGTRTASPSTGVRTTAGERAGIKRTIAGVYSVVFQDSLRPEDIELNQLRNDDEEADIYLPEVGINFREWRRWSTERRLEVLLHELAHVENYDDGHAPSFYDRLVDLVDIAEDWQTDLEAIVEEPIDFELLKRHVVESVHEETIETATESVDDRKRALCRAFGLPKGGHY